MRCFGLMVPVLMMFGCSDGSDRVSEEDNDTNGTYSAGPVCGLLERNAATYETIDALKAANADYFHMSACTAEDGRLAVHTQCEAVYAPACISIETPCAAEPCSPALQTYPNRCTAEADPGTAYLFSGECFPEIPTEWMQWYDGCNTCSRDANDPESIDCTLRSCSVPDAPYTATELSSVPEAPEYCRQWFDGCNTCYRDEPGETPFCTERACDTYLQPYCSEIF